MIEHSCFEAGDKSRYGNKNLCTVEQISEIALFPLTNGDECVIMSTPPP